MATSGTTNFNLDLLTVIEESYERCGTELRSGYDLDTARRSLNLLLIEWVNRGINLWTIDQQSIPLVQGQIQYALPADTVDVLDTVIRQGTGVNQIDINITRVSETNYSTIPNKNTLGRPIQVWIDRQSGQVNPDGTTKNIVINIWPTASADNTYTFVYWRMRRIQDAGQDGRLNFDLPFRFYPALCAGLAAYLCLKIPEAASRYQMLKQEYNEAYQLAADEDRDRSGWRIVPWNSPTLY